ncbi:MAG: DUF1833 family protein [Chloroflexota bacterium]|nr:DUF1833 family protein [Chloroflexota bacterium]
MTATLALGYRVTRANGDDGAVYGLVWLQRQQGVRVTGDLDPVALPTDLVAGGATATLNRLAVYDNRSLAFLGLDDTEVQMETSGPDLVPLWERSTVALRLDAGTLSVTIPGPDVSGNLDRDATEPYIWAFGGAASDAVHAFMQAFDDLSRADQTGITVTLTAVPVRKGAAALDAGSPAVTAKGRQPVVHGSAAATAGVPEMSATGRTGLVTFLAGTPEVSAAGRTVTVARKGAATAAAGSPGIAASGRTVTVIRKGAAEASAGSPSVTANGFRPVGKGAATATAGVPAITLRADIFRIKRKGRVIFRTDRPARPRNRPSVSATGRVAKNVRKASPVFSAGVPAVTATGKQPVIKVSPTIQAGIPRVTARGRQPVAGGAATFEALAPTVAASGREIRIPKRKGAAALAAGRPVFTAAGRARLYTIDVARTATSPEQAILTALEITHPDVAQPLRVVDATEGRTIEGNAYVALRFQARLAQDEESRAPRAEIAMDNVGREATRWIDEAGGGAGAAVRVMQMLDAAVPQIEWEMTLDVLRVSIDSERLVARLGFDPGLGRPAVTVRHDPQTTPGIF